jgi:hypothetical protein
MYVVTGITGRVGGITGRTLLDVGLPVRAVVRDATKGVAWKERGCQVALADMNDAPALAAALTREGDLDGSQSACSERSPHQLFYELVGAQQERLRNRQDERLGGRQVDDEFELGRLLDREVGRLRPAQNLVDIVGGAPKLIWPICYIGHQTSGFDELPDSVHGRQSRAQRQGVDANAVGDYERVGNDIKGVRAALERLEGRSDILGP